MRAVRYLGERCGICVIVVVTEMGVVYGLVQGCVVETFVSVAGDAVYFTLSLDIL